MVGAGEVSFLESYLAYLESRIEEAPLEWMPDTNDSERARVITQPPTPPLLEAQEAPNAKSVPPRQHTLPSHCDEIEGGIMRSMGLSACAFRRSPRLTSRGWKDDDSPCRLVPGGVLGSRVLVVPEGTIWLHADLREATVCLAGQEEDMVWVSTGSGQAWRARKGFSIGKETHTRMAWPFLNVRVSVGRPDERLSDGAATQLHALGRAQVIEFHDGCGDTWIVCAWMGCFLAIVAEWHAALR